MSVPPPITDSWAYIPGFPEYVVTDKGEIWSCRQSKGSNWIKLKFYCHKGYNHVTLYTPDVPIPKVYNVAQLVLLAFVGPKPPGQESCHYPNTDPSDNRLCNLRWGTRKENIGDISKAGHKARGEDSPVAKLTNDQVREIRRLASLGTPYRSIGAQFAVSKTYVGRIVRKEIWAFTE